MDPLHQTPVKESAVEEAFSNLKISKPADDTAYPDDIISDAAGFDAADDSGAWGVKRLAGHRTIEGTPLSDGFPNKRLDPKATPSCFQTDHMTADDEANTATPFKEFKPLDPLTPECPLAPVEKKLLVVNTASASLLHDTGDHQENQLRTEQIAGPSGCLRRVQLEGNIEWQAEEDIVPAALTDILRVHEYSYIAHLEAKVKQSAPDTATGSSSIPSFYAPAGYLDIDTPLSSSSLDAAKRFCGGAMLAVDKVLQSPSDITAKGPVRSAFVIGRPPGHHAGPNGCVPPPCFWQRPDMTSSGFCLLNTVAVAAAHARSKYSVDLSRGGGILQGHHVNSRPLRVAIVDIDIHHGNGTEEIVRNLTPHMMDLPLPSSWAPMSVQSYKPWYNEEDANGVFFSSIHLYGGSSFYPCSGEETPLSELSENKDGARIINIGLTPIGPGTANNTLSKKVRLRAELTNKQRTEYCKIASNELRSKVVQKLLPSLTEFTPDLLLISSGFDAHYDDMYHFLGEDDFHWLTKSLSETCPRVISVMEGGYSLKPVVLQGSSEATEKAEFDRFAIYSPQQAPIKKESVGASKSTRTKAAAKNAPLVVDSSVSTGSDSQPPDGGLIKAVMAHACALTGREGWNN